MPLINFRRVGQFISRTFTNIKFAFWWFVSIFTMSNNENDNKNNNNNNNGDNGDKNVSNKLDVNGNEYLRSIEMNGDFSGFSDYILKTPCAICGLCPIMNPCKSQCNHLFCYYCLRGTLLTEGGRMRCPVCYEMITQHFRIVPVIPKISSATEPSQV